MSSLAELSYAWRSLRRTPAFTITAAVALAIGIGANVAIFSLVDAMLIRPFPLTQPDRLVEVWEDGSHIGFPRNTPAPANFVDWKKRNHVFTDLAAVHGDLYAITGDGQPEEVDASRITSNLLPLLGVSPVLGRNISPDEDRAGGVRTVLLSYRLWQQRYGGARSIIGRDIQLDRIPFRVVGVMPAGFRFPGRSDIWIPMALSPAALADRDDHYLHVFGRLRPGVAIADAQRDMAAIAGQLAREFPESNTYVGASVVGLRDQVLGKLDLALRVLAAGACCVLLVCCANIAGLMLARGAGRQREMAVRAALGASRARLVRIALLESLLIACAGTLLGVFLASEAVPWLGQLVPDSIAGWAQPRIDGRLLLLASCLSMGAAALFGCLPAMTMTRVDLAGALKEAGRSAIQGNSRLRRVLVTGEVALTVVLSVGAGLMVQTLWRLSHVDLGFQPQGVLTVRTGLARGVPYDDFRTRSSFYQRVLANVQAMPGVSAAGYTTFLPLTNRGGTSGFLIEGAPPLAPGQDNDANHRAVSRDYFRAIGTPLLAGRYFNDLDGPDATPVAIVNEAMAKQFWPGQSPLGRRFRMDADGQPWVTIVGVVASARQMGLDVAGRAEMYFPSTQAFGMQGYFTPRDLAVKVKGDPLTFATAVREAIWSVDRNQPVSDVQPLEWLVTKQLTAQKEQLWLLASFAAIALLLAAIGLYGLLSYLVLQRTRDIGLRMALGARRSAVMGEVLRQGLKLVAIGLALGMAGAALLTRVTESLLFGVKSSDAATYGVVAMVLVVTGTVACLVPALRATRIDPAIALRGE
jgi:putative ABC transport system permease protein